jgi:hypothetical protein
MNFCSSIKALREKAQDVLQLPNDHEAIRLDGEIYIIDKKANKITEKFKDIYPENPARATYHLIQKLRLASSYNSFKNSLDKNRVAKEVWTCGFRPSEERWVWYNNSEPKMTLNFRESSLKIADMDLGGCNCEKDYFLSAKFGVDVISKIKSFGLEKTAKVTNALILESSFMKVACPKCNFQDNYTIDDLVDEDRQASYDAGFVICGGCNELISLEK